MIELDPNDPGRFIVTLPVGARDTQHAILGGTKVGSDRLSLPATSLNVLRLWDAFGDDILEGPDEIIDLAVEPWGFRGFTPAERATAEEHPRWLDLFPFQRLAVEYLFCNPHSASLLALSPGLGKSAVTIVTIDLLGFDKILILAPLTLTFNWRREFKRWSMYDRDITRAHAKAPAPGPEVTATNHETIQELVLRDEDGTTFDIDGWCPYRCEGEDPDCPGCGSSGAATWIKDARRVKEWIEGGPWINDPKSGKLKPQRERIVRVRRDYRDAGWDLIAVDESILLKNRRAVKTNVLGSLQRAADETIWELSGSPTAKYRDDLFRQLQVMAPRAFTSYWRFAEFMCVVEKGQWGWKIVGDRPEVDAHSYLRDFMFVRSQDEVLPELPDYIVRDIDLEASPRQRRALDEMFEEWIAVLEEAPDDPVVADTWLARLTRLMQMTSNLGSLPKHDGSFHRPGSVKQDLLIDMIKGDEIELPLLVWTWYVETTQLLTTKLATLPGLNVGSVTGRDSRDAKDATIEAYRDGELNVLVCQMGVGKFGHTFTDTRTVFYHDRAFDSDAWVQSLRRVRRIGLEHRPVLIIPRVVASADALVDENLAGKLPAIASMTNSQVASLLVASRDDRV